MDRLQTLTVATASVALILAGCGGHESSKKGTTTAPVTTAPVNTNNPPPPPPPPTTVLSVSAPVGSLAAARIAPDAVAMALDLTVSGGGSARLTGMTITAAGTVNEATGLGALKIVGDDNKNGLVDAGERVMATVASPAFAQDNGTVAVTFTQSITIASGASLRVIVAVDASATGAAAVAKIGSTISMRIAAASDVTATSNGQAITPTGTWPVSGGSATLFLHDHLLITEVVTQPTTQEYVELFNPTGRTIDLSNYYLTDYTLIGTPPGRYHLTVTGTGFAPTLTGGDFVTRFPAGASIAPGECKVVALDGTTFTTAFPGRVPSFVMRNAGAGSQQMLTWSGTAWTNTPLPATYTSGTSQIVLSLLSNLTEPVILFHWDGQTDLVQDVDYVFWGGTSAANSQVDKTGINVDGPDAGTTPSTYLPDTPAATQMLRAVAAPTFTSNGAQRIDFTEGAETKTGGNGITGNNETSEDFTQTFVIGPATPGVP